MGQANGLDSRRAWGVVALLFLAQVINYFDKGVIGLAAVPIMDELRLSSEQYGFVASAFFSLYAVSGVLTGFFLAHRIRGKVLLAGLVVIWSISTLPIVFLSSLTTLIVCRIVLGIGEGPANATSMSICHEWFSSDRRNMPSALLTLGASVGSFAAGPILTHFIVSYGWRSAFLLCSLLGFVWLAAWLAFGRDGPDSLTARRLAQPETGSEVPGENLPQAAVWGDPTIVGSVIVGFTAYWVVGFTIAWLAPMLQQGMGFSAIETGWITSLVAATNSVLLLAISYVSQHMILRGKTSRTARGVINALCMIGGGAALIAAALVTDPVTKVALIALGGGLPTLTFTLGPALVSGVVPVYHRSRTIIVLYAGITLAGLVSPWLAGRIVGERGLAGFDNALLANAAVVLIGGVAGLVLLHPDRTIARFANLAGARRASLESFPAG